MLLVLLILNILEDLDLLETVVELSQLVEVEQLGNDQDKHDWAHSELVLHLGLHMLSGLFIAHLHEQSHECFSLLLREQVENVEHDEGADRLSEFHMDPPVSVAPDGHSCHLAHGEDD